MTAEGVDRLVPVGGQPALRRGRVGPPIGDSHRLRAGYQEREPRKAERVAQPTTLGVEEAEPRDGSSLDPTGCSTLRTSCLDMVTAHRDRLDP